MEQERCGSCGDAGRAVGIVTLKALLKPLALERLRPGTYSFCSSPQCPVVYFGSTGAFRTDEIAVPVYQKEIESRRTICYCFDVREDRLRAEIEATGHSTSASMIRELVGKDRCACELRNPQGSCCLGNVAALLKSSRQ